MAHGEDEQSDARVNHLLMWRGLVVSESNGRDKTMVHGETEVLGMAVVENGRIVPKGAKLAAKIGTRRDDGGWGDELSRTWVAG